MTRLINLPWKVDWTFCMSRSIFSVSWIISPEPPIYKNKSLMWLRGLMMWPKKAVVIIRRLILILLLYFYSFINTCSSIFSNILKASDLCTALSQIPGSINFDFITKKPSFNKIPWDSCLLMIFIIKFLQFLILFL